jgi:hypothetical protein
MANYAHIEDNKITGVYDLVPENWRNVSNFYVLYESEPTIVRELGWRTITKAPYEYDPETQLLMDPTYDIIDDEVIEYREVKDRIATSVTEPTVITYSDAELLNIKYDLHAAFMERLRQKRNMLLSETDYTQLPDVMAANGTELTEQYVIYRQQLRDLPSLYEDNLDYSEDSQVTYPAIPGK